MNAFLLIRVLSIAGSPHFIDRSASALEFLKFFSGLISRENACIQGRRRRKHRDSVIDFLMMGREL